MIKCQKMEDYYKRYWKNEIEAGTMDKPPLHDNALLVQKKLNKFKKYLNGKCLDAGCGDGFVTSELNKITPTIGLDFSDVAIKKAKKNYPQIRFIKGSVTNLPFNKNQFDCIFASELIEHIQDSEAMFYEFNRVLRKNGNLIITTPELTKLKNIFIALFYWDKYYHPVNPHIRFYSKKSITEILKRFGFKIIHYEPDGRFFWFVPKGMIIVAKKIK